VESKKFVFLDVAPATKKIVDHLAGTVSVGTRKIKIGRLLKEVYGETKILPDNEESLEYRFVEFKHDAANKIVAMRLLEKETELTMQMHFATSGTSVYIPWEIQEAVKPCLNKHKSGNYAKNFKYFKYNDGQLGDLFCFSYGDIEIE